MQSTGMFLGRLTEVLAGEDDGLVSAGRRGDPIRVLAKESTRLVDARTDAEVLSEIKAQLLQEALISGRGFLY